MPWTDRPGKEINWMVVKYNNYLIDPVLDAETVLVAVASRGIF